MFRSCLSIWLLICVAAAHAAEDSDRLPLEATDPTAPLPVLSLREDYAARLWHAEGQRETFVLGVTNPFYAWRQANLFHLAVPYQASEGLAQGTGSTQAFNLLIFEQNWGRWGLGYDLRLNPPVLNREGLQSGPALGIVRDVGRCRFGALNLNYFGDELSLSLVQIIAGCDLGRGWTLSSGLFDPRYDWRSGRLVDLPLSLQLARVFNLAGQPVQVFVNPQYNAQPTRLLPEWTFSFGVNLVADPFSRR